MKYLVKYDTIIRPIWINISCNNDTMYFDKKDMEELCDIFSSFPGTMIPLQNVITMLSDYHEAISWLFKLTSDISLDYKNRNDFRNKCIINELKCLTR